MDFGHVSHPLAQRRKKSKYEEMDKRVK
jgi:hypothetical protein